MKNKQKAWRRPEVQAKYRKEALKAIVELAQQSGRAGISFLGRWNYMQRCRVGRMVKEHLSTMPRLA